MKYLLFIFLTSLFLNTQAQANANFINTLGAECGRMLYRMNEYLYHDDIKLNKIQLSKINELKTCLDLYTQYGGDFKELNIRYYTALGISGCFYRDYIKSISSSNSQTEDKKAKELEAANVLKKELFNNLIKNSNCLNYYLYKDKYPECSEIIYLKTICELSTQNNENTIDTTK